MNEFKAAMQEKAQELSSLKSKAYLNEQRMQEEVKAYVQLELEWRKHFDEETEVRLKSLKVKLQEAETSLKSSQLEVFTKIEEIDEIANCFLSPLLKSPKNNEEKSSSKPMVKIKVSRCCPFSILQKK